MFVTTADTTTLSFSTPSLVVVQQLTSIRFNSSALGFPLSAGACCESFLLLASFTHSPRLSSSSCFFTLHHTYNITSSSAFNKYFSFLHHSSRIYFRTSFFILFCMHVVHWLFWYLKVMYDHGKLWVTIDQIRIIYPLSTCFFSSSSINLAHARLLTIRISSQTESSQDCCVFIYLVTYDVIEYNLIKPPARRTLPFA